MSKYNSHKKYFSPQKNNYKKNLEQNNDFNYKDDKLSFTLSMLGLSRIINFFNEKNFPANRGVCSWENFCFCFDGYSSTYESNVLCDYEQKDRTISMMKNIFMRIIIGKSLKEIIPSSNCHIQDTKEVGYPPSR